MELGLNFIYFTTITKQVIQLILIMLVGTDVCVRMVVVVMTIARYTLQKDMSTKFYNGLSWVKFADCPVCRLMLLVIYVNEVYLYVLEKLYS